MGMTRADKHTAMLLALGPPPVVMRYGSESVTYGHWVNEAHEYLTALGFNGPRIRGKVIDDFIIWLGELEARKWTEKEYGSG